MIDDPNENIKKGCDGEANKIIPTRKKGFKKQGQDRIFYSDPVNYKLLFKTNIEEALNQDEFKEYIKTIIHDTLQHSNVATVDKLKSIRNFSNADIEDLIDDKISTAIDNAIDDKVLIGGSNR